MVAGEQTEETLRRLAIVERASAATKNRLDEAEETLRAIRNGEVDALVISDGLPDERVFTLSSVDKPYRIFVENMSDGAATLSQAGLVLYANPRLVDLLDYSMTELIGSSLLDFTAAESRNELSAALEHHTSAEITFVAADGHLVPMLIGASKLEVEHNQLTCVTLTDLTAQKAQTEVIRALGRVQSDQLVELQAAEATLTFSATHDSLTGLPNRVLLIDRIEQALAQAARSGAWTGVLFIDLDRFKRVNDSRGHGTGDDVLRGVAERFRATLRTMDTLSRIGGDEFVVLIPDLVDRLEAGYIATRLRQSLEAPVGPGGTVVTASIGVAIAEAGASSAEVMLHQSDTAMYHAKSLGRDRTEVFDIALSQRQTQRAATEDLLTEALAEHRLLPHYQPIVDLAAGGVAGFEALARILQADQSVLFPDAFIGVAEDSGLIIELGAQMLSTASQHAEGWPPSAGGGCPSVAVNLSPRQLEQSDFAKYVSVVLANSGLDPTRLHLEITETALMQLSQNVLAQLHRVRDLGVEIGLDDFGTGYASLTHLRRLPVTFVKLDRSFISGLGADIQDEQIVAALIDLTAKLGLRSIAEGIETPQQLDRLRELGCDQGQGYLFQRPAADVGSRRSYGFRGSDYPAR
jgi:diguanylate cyclase (GGDEF)-like protein/PAS domain S-box-containing protein